MADFNKLRTLRAPAASHVGLLLVGFDAEHEPGFVIPDGDIIEVKKRTDFESVPRIERPTWWSDDHQNAQSLKHNEGFRVRCWFWYRAVLA